MQYTARRALPPGVSGVNGVIALAVVLAGYLPGGAWAQEGESVQESASVQENVSIREGALGQGAATVQESTSAQEGASEIPDLAAVWQRIRVQRTDDGLEQSPRGFGRPSEFPLNARGIAIQEAFDEFLHPMYDCVPATIPQIFGDPYNFSIEQLGDRVLIRFEKDDVRRTVWLDGHGHREATANDVSIQGFSTGRYENGELVVETTRYAFNPSGINDRSPMAPSSTSKRTVERFSREGDVLTVDVIVEDPLMMTGPVRFSYQFEPVDTPLLDWIPCDPAQARAPLRYIPEEDLKYGIR